MGCPVLCVILLSSLLCLFGVQTQDLRERDALCSEDGCYVLHFQRKIFLDAWRSCKEQGGDLATIRHPKEAEMVKRLFSNVELRPHHRGKASIWIGLQRQPRQCSPTRLLRGFSWVTGDQDTQHTNWLHEYSASTCSSPRCVAMPYSTAAHDQENNLKWKDGPCSVSLDGYLCRHNFKGMCTAIVSEGGGNTFYSTPFNLLSTLLTHVPFGSVATVPCPAKDDQKVLCSQKEDGTISWNRDPPFCTDAPKMSWCDKDNAGCHHKCIETGLHYYCDCNEGFVLAQDGVSCFLSNPCDEAPCEYECLIVTDGYRCACPDGYMLAPDEQGCVDVDECLQSPCEHICVNSPGTFECRCRDGYQQDEEGACEDVDECLDNPCEHACENTMGSHICHCHVGFAPLQEDQSRCHDVDECQFEGTCEQMCVNSQGGFDCYCKEGYNLQRDQYSCILIGEDLETKTPDFSPHPPIWNQEQVVYLWNPQTESDWRIPQNWQTELPNVDTETESPLEVINVDGEFYPKHPFLDIQDERRHQPERPVQNAFFPPTIPPPTPDYYEDESTMVPTDLSSSTALGGAWNRLRFSSVPTDNVWTTEEEPEITTETESPLEVINVDGAIHPEYPIENVFSPPTIPMNTPDYYEDESTTVPTDPPSSTALEGAWDLLLFSPTQANPETQETAKDPLDSLGADESYDQDLDINYRFEEDSTAFGPGQQTSTLFPTQSQDAAKNNENSQGTSWLLVGLLVPLCIFIVVMLVLGIIYCTRYIVKPQNKNTSDCYHWIAGAGDKAAADLSGSGPKSHV